MTLTSRVTRAVRIAGLVSFTASADHASLIGYEGRVRAQGSDVTSLVIDLGKPTPDGSNVCTVDIGDDLAGLSAGHYVMAVVAITAVGPSDEVDSNAFTV